MKNKFIYETIKNALASKLEEDNFITNKIKRLIENPVFPLIYPKKFIELLYNNNKFIKKYGMQNPNAFNLIRPYILKKNSSKIINKKWNIVYHNYIKFT